VPVTAPVVAVGRVTAWQAPGPQGRAHDLPRPVRGLGDGLGRIQGVDRDEHFDAGLDLYEFYVAGPESSPDPANWHTELNQPLI